MNNTELQQVVRDLRRRYDSLAPGPRAILRRCKSTDELLLEGAYWRLLDGLQEWNAPALVMVFPEAPHGANLGRFSFGRFLRQRLPPGEHDRSLRFRRLIQADRAELPRHLRNILRLASGGHVAVDWGVLGADVLRFGEVVQRRWVQDYFAPIATSETSTNLQESSDQ